MTVHALTHHAPEFLREAYRLNLILVDHERHLPGGIKYLTYEPGQILPWRVWRMTRQRVPIPIGACYSIGEGIYNARK